MMVKQNSFAKLFFLVTFTGLLMYIVLAIYSFQSAISDTWKDGDASTLVSRKNMGSDKDRFDKDLKYVLMWNFKKMWSNHEEGQESFVKANCKNINCYVTWNRSLLNGDYTNFDAILFYNFEGKPKSRPKKRKASQKYVFYNYLPSEENVICNVHADGFFNWTWTYKIYSDILSPFIEVRDKKYNHYVAPNRIVTWVREEDLKPFTKEQLQPFKDKKKAVAWYADRCHTRNNRMEAVLELQEHLHEHKMELDIFGKCGTAACPNKTFESCIELFKKEYYFVLAYEESFSEDYVTKEVLNAYNSFAVPIVWGKNDYKKFLPGGSYINTEHLSTEELAAMVVYIIRNPEVYHNYFRWREHYEIRKYDLSQSACDFCQLLNSNEATRYSSYDNFRTWWYSIGSLREKCLPYSFEMEYHEQHLKKMVIRNDSRPWELGNVSLL